MSTIETLNGLNQDMNQEVLVRIVVPLSIMGPVDPPEEHRSIMTNARGGRIPNIIAHPNESVHTRKPKRLIIEHQTRKRFPP
jgi:hypothetical protein